MNPTAGKTPDTASDEEVAPAWEERAAWWIALAIVVAGAVLRLHLIDMPLDRDEGEYAYGGQLLLRGILPYEGLYSMKLPGMYLINALWLRLFGETLAAVHIGLLLSHSATALLMFVLGRRMGDARMGWVAAACFTVLACTQAVDGMSANAEHFVVLPLVAGLVLLFDPRELPTSRRAFAIGLLLGLAVVVKQHAAVFALFAAILLALEASRRSVGVRATAARGIAYAAGVSVPYLLLCSWMAAAGNFSNFWFWTVRYAREYSTSAPAETALTALALQFSRVFAPTALLWLLAALGLLLAPRSRVLVHHRWSLPLFALFSLIAISPGFYFRSHYFVLVLPCAALLTAVAIDALCRLRIPRVAPGRMRWLGYAALVLALGSGIAHEWSSLFLLSPDAVSRRRFGLNPFPEAVALGRYIRENSEPGARIAVLGSEPEVYFYSRLEAATGFVYTYPLMEEQPYAVEMQRQMISDIEAAEPDYLVFVSVGASWLQEPTSSREIFDWYDDYSREHYVIDGLIEVREVGSAMSWGSKVLWPPRSDAWIALMKRIPRVDSRVEG